MLTLFWDDRGVILDLYMPKGNTVTIATYADLLKNHVHPAVKSKWCGHLSTGILLQHDSVRPCTACSTVATIQDLFFEGLPHLPYSPDLIPSDFHIFDRSKRRLEASLSGSTKRCSRRCMSGCALTQNNFFSRGIHALPNRWNTCMEHNGDYIEKWSHCVPFVFNKLRDKKYMKFSFDSPSYIPGWCVIITWSDWFSATKWFVWITEMLQQNRVMWNHHPASAGMWKCCY